MDIFKMQPGITRLSLDRTVQSKGLLPFEFSPLSARKYRGQSEFETEVMVLRLNLLSMHFEIFLKNFPDSRPAQPEIAHVIAKA